MQLSEENLKNLGQLLDPTGIIKKTRDELLDAFKKIVELVNKMKADNNKQMDNILASFNSLEAKLTSTSNSSLTKNERVVASELESLLRRFSAEQKKIDNRLAEIKDGQDADETKIVQEVLNRVPKLQEIVNETIKQLPKGEFSIDDIDGLNEALREIETKITGSRRFGGGGFSKIAMDSHIIENETPTGTVNGVNTDFALAGTPNPSTSLKVFVNGQRMQLTGDYTLSVNTITFLTAPPTSSIILCDYRT